MLKYGGWSMISWTWLILCVAKMALTRFLVLTEVLSPVTTSANTRGFSWAFINWFALAATRGTSSTPTPFRPHRLHSIRLVPSPAKRSRIQSPFPVYLINAWYGIWGMKLPQYSFVWAPPFSLFAKIHKLSRRIPFSAISFFHFFRSMSFIFFLGFLGLHVCRGYVPLNLCHLGLLRFLQLSKRTCGFCFQKSLIIGLTTWY